MQAQNINAQRDGNTAQSQVIEQAIFQKSNTAQILKHKQAEIGQEQGATKQDAQESQESSFLNDEQSQSQENKVKGNADSFLDEEEIIDDPEKDSDLQQLGEIESIAADSQEQQSDKEQPNKKKTTKKLKLKDYQITLFKNSRDKNSIIYLPTGTGKTMIAIVSMYYYLCKEGRSKKIVFLANTIQLVKQQADAIKKCLASIIQDQNLAKEIRHSLGDRYADLDWDKDRIRAEVCCIHGQKNDEIGMTKRKKIENMMLSKKQFLDKIQNSTVIVMISQMFLNCLRRGYLNLADFSFVVFDECHHATGDRAVVSHPYAGVMNEFYFNIKKEIQKQANAIHMHDSNKRLPIIMGLTASPIAQPEKDPHVLWKKVEQLRDALDANYAFYPKCQNLKSQTDIRILRIQECNQKQMFSHLISYFEIYRGHRQSLAKLKTYFPAYYKCVTKVIELLGSKHKQLALDFDKNAIHEVQLMVFYDLKECLLIKLRDLWLQLGEYAFYLGFRDLLSELKQINLKKQNYVSLMEQVFSIFASYLNQFDQTYNKCQENFFSGKLNQLIKLLSQNQYKSNNQQPEDMVLVFAFKRRTVKYLEKVINKYKDQLPEQKKKLYECVGITGYSSQGVKSKTGDAQKIASDPTQDDQHFIGYIQKFYQGMLQQMASNTTQQKGESDKLTSEMKKFFNQKQGKLLLQVEEKYTKQIQKIQKFKNRQYRVLITTSVTEEGFDIPGCNTVISFDTPSSMKSYIQIKGRARKKLSKYFIFTTAQNHENTIRQKESYDATIDTTYNIAIDKLALQTQRPKINNKIQDGYKYVKCKGTGAVINTNYALQILKSFLSSLRAPNKAIYYLIVTPNTCFKCIIKFPPTCPSSVPYVVGEPHTRKSRAIKSAAYRAVIHLYKEGYIKNDLRPRRYEELEEQRQVEKYQDIRIAREDAEYMSILIKYSQIQIETQKQPTEVDSEHLRKFMRFYYKPIQGIQLDFPMLNKRFKEHLPIFQKEKFSFQMYMINFSGLNKMINFNSKDDNEIGLITCFPIQYVNQIFEGFQYTFEQACLQKFSFKLVEQNLDLTRAQYQKLKKVHNFLIAGCQNRQLQHYSNITESSAFLPNWLTIMNKRSGYMIDSQRQFYPIVTLLKKSQKNNNISFQIDENANMHIIEHQRIFKNLFIYHNRKQKQYVDPFPVSLVQPFKQFLAKLKDREKYTLIQSITKHFCFHKCIITSRENFTEEIESSSKKKKASLNTRIKKMQTLYDHMKIKNNEVVKVHLWRKYEKDIKTEYFKRNNSLKIENQDSSSYYLLKQFLPYPVSPQVLFKISLASKYAFKALYEYALAFKFRNQFLHQLFCSKLDSVKNIKPFSFQPYSNVILENPKIFEELSRSGRSIYLRNIGDSSLKGSTFIPPQVSFSINESSIQFSKNYDNSESDISLSGLMNGSSLNLNNTDISILMKQGQKNENIKDSWFKLRIPQVLKVLTSRIYKSGNNDNYEQYEFIGDVVLKLLSTIQVFLKKPEADEGTMHISRANIICNANLHRKAIKHKVFRYILTSKKEQAPPPCKINYDSSVPKTYYEETHIQMVSPITEAQGFQYIPGKVHADVVEALIGIFYLTTKNLQSCQSLLFCLDILQKPNLNLNYLKHKRVDYLLPALYTDFEKRIGYTFNDKGLLIQCFTHSSFRSLIQTVVDNQSVSNLIQKAELNEQSKISFMSEAQSITAKSKVTKHQTFYERLEFLGDSILDLIVVQFLHNKYHSHMDEGTLTLLKQSGVSNKTLGLIALRYGMHELILMDIPENDQVLKQFNRIKVQFNLYMGSPEQLLKLKVHALKLLGDVFQALVGAIFLDCELKYQKAKQIVMKIAGQFFNHFTEMQNLKACPGYKFKEYLQKNNYRNYTVQKDTYTRPQNGKFKFVLVDRSGTVISQCWQENEKKAWDVMQEQFTENMQSKAENQSIAILNQSL